MKWLLKNFLLPFLALSYSLHAYGEKKEEQPFLIDEIVETTTNLFLSSIDLLPELPEKIETKKVRRFYFLPNAFSIRPYAHKSLETEGFLDEQSFEKSIRKLNFLRFWSIAHLHYPRKHWTWGLRFSPSLNYYSWDEGGKVRFVQISYSAKLLWHLKKRWGSFQLASGLGAMWVKGNLATVGENKLTPTPRLQVSYFNFVSKKFFIQFKYTKNFFVEDIFKTDTFKLNNFSSTGLYFGYYFGDLK